jgi:hypothetical protein
VIAVVVATVGAGIELGVEVDVGAGVVATKHDFGSRRPVELVE